MKIKLAIPIIVVVVSFVSILVLNFVIQSPLEPSVTQQDLRNMVDEWIKNPDEDDTQQRLEIMKAFYTFEESGQRLSDDNEGKVLLNQIRKMVSIQIPKAQLDEIRQEIRDELRSQGVNITEP